MITPDVHELRDELGFPGMAVLLWAFGSARADSPHRLENHRRNQVVYTSTHDTDTLAGFFPDQDPWDLLELALSSRAALAMVPVQDVLGLGSEARMDARARSTTELGLAPAARAADGRPCGMAALGGGSVGRA